MNKNPTDLILRAMYAKDKFTENDLVVALQRKVNELASKKIYYPIDFKFFQGRLTSDVVDSNLWWALSSDIIRQDKDTYHITEFGRNIRKSLLEGGEPD